jgi:hypothetical protein
MVKIQVMKSLVRCQNMRNSLKIKRIITIEIKRKDIASIRKSKSEKDKGFLKKVKVKKGSEKDM